jgi:hypothetical protein
MNTGQTILTIGAFILLSTILQGMLNSTSMINDDIGSSQDGIMMTSLAVSYSEHINSLRFDSVTAGGAAVTDLSLLTYPCGPEPGEVDMATFDDIDDLNGYSEERVGGNSNRRYRAAFTVSYCDPTQVDQNSGSRCLTKRLDMKIWRSFPPRGRDEYLDTLKASLVMGYFNFN